MLTVIVGVRGVEDGRGVLCGAGQGLVHRRLEGRVAGDALKLPASVCVRQTRRGNQEKN